MSKRDEKLQHFFSFMSEMSGKRIHFASPITPDVLQTVRKASQFKWHPDKMRYETSMCPDSRDACVQKTSDINALIGKSHSWWSDKGESEINAYKQAFIPKANAFFASQGLSYVVTDANPELGVAALDMMDTFGLVGEVLKDGAEDSFGLNETS